MKFFSRSPAAGICEVCQPCMSPTIWISLALSLQINGGSDTKLEQDYPAVLVSLKKHFGLQYLQTKEIVIHLKIIESELRNVFQVLQNQG
ncbi:hypothetical protein L6164_008168 [Bauhinia variegata]|uniref:Uncharacterized protein n=1 Tax=Bauhinia variegata TaxID=167791 RepID=A0ACB9PEW5_BAUVA|nr:hypothetical protein L6164_008168 [Bauhinia variegata]